MLSFVILILYVIAMVAVHLLLKGCRHDWRITFEDRGRYLYHIERKCDKCGIVDTQDHLTK